MSDTFAVFDPSILTAQFFIDTLTDTHLEATTAALPGHAVLEFLDLTFEAVGITTHTFRCFVTDPASNEFVIFADSITTDAGGKVHTQWRGQVYLPTGWFIQVNTSLAAGETCGVFAGGHFLTRAALYP